MKGACGDVLAKGGWGGGGRVRGGVGVRDVGACGYKICKGSER